MIQNTLRTSQLSRITGSKSVLQVRGRDCDVSRLVVAGELEYTAPSMSENDFSMIIHFLLIRSGSGQIRFSRADRRAEMVVTSIPENLGVHRFNFQFEQWRFEVDGGWSIVLDGTAGLQKKVHWNSASIRLVQKLLWRAGLDFYLGPSCFTVAYNDVAANSRATRGVKGLEAAVRYFGLPLRITHKI